MRYFFSFKKKKPEERRDQTPKERMETQIRRKGRHSVSFSIAYVETVAWIKDPIGNCRPKPETLDLAEVHAIRLEDPFVLEGIEKARAEWKATESTPTPKLPPPPGPDDLVSPYSNIVEIGPTNYKDHYNPEAASSRRSFLDAKIDTETDILLERLKSERWDD